jgi:hypothetical protein
MVSRDLLFFIGPYNIAILVTHIEKVSVPYSPVWDDERQSQLTFKPSPYFSSTEDCLAVFNYGIRGNDRFLRLDWRIMSVFWVLLCKAEYGFLYETKHGALTRRLQKSAQSGQLTWMVVMCLLQMAMLWILINAILNPPSSLLVPCEGEIRSTSTSRDFKSMLTEQTYGLSYYVKV